MNLNIIYYNLEPSITDLCLMDQSVSLKDSKILGVDTTNKVAMEEVNLYHNLKDDLISITTEGALRTIDKIII